MNFRTTYILFGSLIVLFLLFTIVLIYDPGNKDTSNFVLPVLHKEKDALKQNEITRVEIQRNEPTAETIVFERDASGKRWRIVEPIQTRADTIAVDNLLRQIFDAARAKTDRPPGLAAWGLEPPQEVITLKKGDEQTIKLNIGKEGGVGTSAVIYALDPTRPSDPMAVSKSSLDSVLKPLSDFRDSVLLASTVDDVTEIKISEGSRDPVELQKQEGRWRYTIPAAYGDAEAAGTIAPTDSTKAPSSVNLLLANITNLKLEKASADIVADNVSDSDLAKYNLDAKSPVLRVQVKVAGNEKPVELLIGVGKKVDDKYYYAKLANEKTVVRVKTNDADAIRALLSDRGALRSRTLVATEQPVEAIDIKNAYGLISLRRQAGPKLPQMPGRPPLPDTDTWLLWRGDVSTPTDPAVMSAPDSLLNLLKQKNQIVSFIDLAPKEKQAEQEKDLGLASPAAVVSLWSGDDGIVKEEVKDDKAKDDKAKDDKAKDEKSKGAPKLKNPDQPTFRISFGKQVKGEGDRDLVVVKRETKQKTGDKISYDVTLAYIPLLAFEKAKKGPLAYESKDIPGFQPSGSAADQNVTRLLIQRSGQVSDITRSNDKSPWKIVKPDALANHMADKAKIDGVLGMLNGLRASELIAEKPSKNDLEKVFGLEPPQSRFEITVTKDDKPTVHTLLLGKDGPKDGMRETIYAKTSWHDVVFTLDKSILALMPTDFQDTTVAKFDPANVKTLKLTGWQNVTGVPFTLDLARKDPTAWDVKAPPNFNLDPTKVKALLDALSGLRAEKFVGKLPKPDADLDIEKGALKIEMTFEKDEKPLELVIGKLDGEDYFATSSFVPGEVIQVKKLAFEGLKVGPAFFSQPK
jgi:hypothetical protein